MSAYHLHVLSQAEVYLSRFCAQSTKIKPRSKVNLWVLMHTCTRWQSWMWASQRRFDKLSPLDAPLRSLVLYIQDSPMCHACQTYSLSESWWLLSQLHSNMSRPHSCRSYPHNRRRRGGYWTSRGSWDRGGNKKEEEEKEEGWSFEC